MQVLIAISGFCGFCSRIGNAPCTTPFDFLFVISIYVPAWGTTWFVKSLCIRHKISIHVPAWGTTQSVAACVGRQDYFNPRSRVGNDGLGLGDGALTSKFQSTFPRGERHKALYIFPPPITFQATFPRGERQKNVKLTAGGICDFNPRSRVGNDAPL